jgi:hypothetical protein
MKWNEKPHFEVKYNVKVILLQYAGINGNGQVFV